MKAAAADGKPMYCLMSALHVKVMKYNTVIARIEGCVDIPMYLSHLSTKARSMAPVTLEVVSMRTLGYLFTWSIWVSRAFTTLMASDGSLPDMADCLAAVRLST